MAAEEEDIELDENEIAVTRLALLVLAGLLDDIRVDEPGEVESWEEGVKEQVGLDEDCNLGETLVSALRKFREEDTDYEEDSQEASQD